MQFTPIAVDQTTAITDLLLALAVFVSGVMCDLWSESSSRRLLPWLVIVGLGFYLLTVTMPQGFILFVYYQAAAMGASLITYLYLMARKTSGAGWIALVACSRKIGQVEC